MFVNEVVILTAIDRTGRSNSAAWYYYLFKPNIMTSTFALST